MFETPVLDHSSHMHALKMACGKAYNSMIFELPVYPFWESTHLLVEPCG